MGDLCAACHSSVNEWLARPHVHAPVAAKECESCHLPHGSDNDRLLADEVPALCLGCHDTDAGFRQAHKGYQVADANCLTCHDPHSSTRPKLVMPNEHPPFAGGQCTACHDQSAGASAFALVSDVRSVCTRCHEDIREMAAQPYTHNLGDERSCMNCHNAHTSSTESLLSSRQQTMCLHCHFKDEKYADKSRASVLTHNGMDCTNCHLPHGAANERYFVSNVIDLCSGCHENAHRTSHPIGEDIIDPRSGEQVTCVSCHQLHGADFEPYLPLDSQMDLCIQCHRR
jgi:predicted CXXCH cytochrome family protein